MIVSFHQKFIFVAIPKTAGHAIREALRPNMATTDWEQCGLFVRKRFPIEALAQLRHGHLTCQQLRPHLSDEDWQSCFKFCFVRNPFDRFVSFCFFYYRQTQLMQRDPLGTMKQAIQAQQAGKNILLLRPQHQFITDANGAVMVDYVGRYESLQQSFDHICCTKNLPSQQLDIVNASRRGPFSQYFDAELEEMVRRYYQRDFELFDYDATLNFNAA